WWRGASEAFKPRGNPAAYASVHAAQDCEQPLAGHHEHADKACDERVCKHPRAIVILTIADSRRHRDLPRKGRWMQPRLCHIEAANRDHARIAIVRHVPLLTRTSRANAQLNTTE